MSKRALLLRVPLLCGILLIFVNAVGAPIHEAAATGNVLVVNQLLQEDPNQVNLRDRWGWTPLMYAVRERQVEMVVALLKRGARVSITDRGMKQTALDKVRSYLDQFNDDYINRQVELWKRQGVTEEKIDERVTLFRRSHGPEEQQKWDQIEKLLSEALAKEVASDRQSPLLAAVAQGKIEEVTRLLEAGSHTEAKDDSGRTPLMLAVTHGEIEIAQILLNHGASMSEQDLQGNTPYTSARQMFELFVAARRERDHQDMRTLIEEGKLDVNAKDENGETPLMRAVAEGRLEDVKFLLSVGARTDITNGAGQSLSALACTRVPGRHLKEQVLQCIEPHEPSETDGAGRKSSEE